MNEEPAKDSGVFDKMARNQSGEEHSLMEVEQEPNIFESSL